MPQSLYQKYRPDSWGGIVGQQHITVTLQNALSRDQLSHAYLFVGPRGVGKTTTARLLAKAANCQKRDKKSGEPCSSCDNCTRIATGQFLDIIEIDAASNTGVDHVRERILGAAEVAAGHGTYRVFIVDEVHMLSIAAFNAMLKMLEEPPSHVMFILATTEAHKVPATIVSRCQRFDFKRLPVSVIEERLSELVAKESVSVVPEVLTAIAREADGSLRDAESTLGQVLAIGGKKITVDIASLVISPTNMGQAAEIIGTALAGQAGESMTLLHRRLEEGMDVNQLFRDCIQWLRALLIAKVNGQADLFGSALPREHLDTIAEQLKGVDAKQIVHAIDVFVARSQESNSIVAELPLELAIVEVGAGDTSNGGTEASA